MTINLPNWLKQLLFCLIAFSIAWLLSHHNRHLVVSYYQVTSQQWPTELSGWRIVQLSDLHNQAVSGPGNQKIIETIRPLQPNLIVLTGDIFDSQKTTIPANLSLISQLNKLAPVYFILGNHDFYNDDYIDLIKQVQLTGATVLRNQAAIIKEKINDQELEITLVGLDDPTVFGGPLPSQEVIQLTNQTIKKINQTSLKQPIILLAHRPELWPTYLQLQPLAILTGHTHGGQIKIPGLKTIYVPNQKTWPDYDHGYFKLDNESHLIINRGIGNSAIDQRFNAYPEIVSLDFYPQPNSD